MHVAVIGAGPSGLVTVKELLEEGHTAVCFEKASSLGGVFRYDEHGGGVYESTRLTSSAFITCFTDFPPPANAAAQLMHADYLNYLHSYAENFGLLPLIKFNIRVENVAALPKSKWRVTFLDQSSQKVSEEDFDAVAVCAGTHQDPHIPEIAGREIFEGTLLHSNAYKRPAAFQEKKSLSWGPAKAPQIS